MLIHVVVDTMTNLFSIADNLVTCIFPVLRLGVCDRHRIRHRADEAHKDQEKESRLCPTTENHPLQLPENGKGRKLVTPFAGSRIH